MNKEGTQEDKNAELRAQVEQLKREANIDRKKVSECVKDLLIYTTQHKAEDFLASGPVAGMENPFQEKKKCSML